MIVSILQLMGLAFGKSIQSRPGPDSQSGAVDKPSKIDNKGTNQRDGDRVAPDQRQLASARSETRLASSSRRQEVKTHTAKPTTPAKAKASADSARKAAKPAKPVAKSPVKAAASTSKPAKDAALVKTEPVSSKVAKRVLDPASSSASAPAARKSPAKAVKTEQQATKGKALAGLPAKTPARAKTPEIQNVKISAPAPTVAKRAAPAPIAQGPAAAPATPVLRPAPTVPTPAKAGRPSRLSQITVPSMAQAVASTAAKASYTNTMSTPELTPPTYTPVKKDPKLAHNWKLKPADQLTDAEVLAMPDDEYMNDKQMAFFRLKLNLLKQGILSNAGETTEHLRADTVVVPDPADRATIEEEHALELRTRDRERKLLKKIEQSIIRIDAGDYGYCDETGEPIGVGRLLARPTATLSLEAQQRRELKQKMFGD